MHRSWQRTRLRLHIMITRVFMDLCMLATARVDPLGLEYLGGTILYSPRHTLLVCLFVLFLIYIFANDSNRFPAPRVQSRPPDERGCVIPSWALHTAYTVLPPLRRATERQEGGEEEGRKGGRAESEGFDALANRVGHIFTSASTWDCTDGIDGVQAQVMHV